MFEKNSSSKSAVSPVIGIILMVAVTVALVTLVTLTVFDIGGNTTSPVDGTVSSEIDKDSRSLGIEVIRNENIEDIKVRGAENPSIVSNEGDVGFENVDIKNGFTKVEILAVVDGTEQIIETIGLPQDVAQPVNLVNNPSFESGSSPDADSWNVDDTAGSGRTSSFAFDGTQSIAMKDLTGGYSGRPLTSDPVSVSGGDKYDVSAYYRLPSSESDFSGTSASDYRYKIELKWLDSTGGDAGENQTTADASAFDSWEKVTLSGTAPNDAVEAEIVISVKEDGNPNGNIYWDSVSLDKPLK